ncbi:MAG: rhodanese-like domain-containing protein [Gaiellaceae bacterium]
MAQPTRRYHVWSALRSSSLRVDPDAAREMMAGGALVIDVRRQEDPSARLEGARRVPPDEIPSALAELPRGAPILLACT